MLTGTACSPVIITLLYVVLLLLKEDICLEINAIMDYT